MKKGKLIIIEGPDGCGKTTFFNKLKEVYASKNIVFFREPGSTPVGEAIRDILLNDDYVPMQYTDILLYTASRYESYMKNIKPALDKGKIVIVDRFLPSTLVYNAETLYDEKLIMRLHSFLDDDDITIVNIDIDEETIMERLNHRTDELNRRDGRTKKVIENRLIKYRYVLRKYFYDQVFNLKSEDLDTMVKNFSTLL